MVETKVEVKVEIREIMRVGHRDGRTKTDLA